MGLAAVVAATAARAAKSTVARASVPAATAATTRAASTTAKAAKPPPKRRVLDRKLQRIAAHESSNRSTWDDYEPGLGITHSLASLVAQMSRSKDQGAVDQLYKTLWNKGGAELLHSSGQRPPPHIFLPPKEGGSGFQGRVIIRNGKPGKVQLPSNEVQDLLSDDQQSRRYALSALLHEWAHTRQKPRVTNDQTYAEGGAEAFARQAAKQLLGGQGYNYSGHPYNPYVQSVKMSKPKRYVRRGQFKQ